jgi:hypothetical protein
VDSKIREDGGGRGVGCGRMRGLEFWLGRIC